VSDVHLTVAKQFADKALEHLQGQLDEQYVPKGDWPRKACLEQAKVYAALSIAESLAGVLEEIGSLSARTREQNEILKGILNQMGGGV
jgi:hypothetical protein